ncbi:MAG: OsmC family protein [Candidatus Izemoplasmatales bacterium]|nr:OsmC family protein [Candidatus Izemoplasmatales bacterium]MDD4354924.1 OsmC family protein [Candidatus Izemoplasmatales bacterium]MDD4987526.1 OsmC family protein [Candidatus Izemoplasmatales bacterium]MDY0372828.1 OsmC family protein [Candidatus Izemoplasmatales bacterium]
MALDNVKFEWNSDYIGQMMTPTGTIPVGDQKGGMQPYHLLFGALGGCFYSTFLVITKKKRLTFSKAEVEISGEKPIIPGEVTTLNQVKILLTIHQPSNKEKIMQSAELATRNCSIHKTIATVAIMQLEVVFLD